jgi:hypothetical protein
LRRRGVTHVLTVAAGFAPKHPNDFTYCLVDVADRPEESLNRWGCLVTPGVGVRLVTWDRTGCHQLIELCLFPYALPGLSLSGVTRIGYMDCTGCHR